MSRLSRREFLRLAAVAATGSLVAACTQPTVVAPSAAPEEAEVSEAPAAAPVDIDFWYIWGGDGGKAMETVSAEFEKANPQAKMHPLTIGGTILDKTIAAFAAGTPPDIVDLILCAPLAARDALISVEDFLETSTVVKQDNYFDAQWDGTRWAGQRWGLPANEGLGWMGLFHNRGLAQEAGLDESAAPATYDELREWSAAITKMDDEGKITTVGYSPGGMMVYPDCVSVVMNQRYFDGEAMKYTFDDPKWVDVLNQEKTFFDAVGAENLADFRESYSGQAIADPVQAGHVGLWTDGSWAPGGLDLNAVEGMEWGVNFMVDGLGEGAKPFFAGTHTMMMLKGTDAELAWKFLEYSATDDYIKMVYDISGFIMGTKSFIASLDTSTLYPGLEFFTTGLTEGTRVWGLASDPNWYLVFYEWIALHEAVGFGQMTAEEGLANLQKLASDELAKLTTS
jgi:maltose-binding protein MalE